jgi:hypothetical protein
MSWVIRLACVATALGAMPLAARGQIRPDEVLVIYDSRVADSLAVAEYYAGSKKVPGGAGGLDGARPGVRVLDLAGTGAVVTTPGDISYANFIARVRDPIRAHLTAMQLERRIRVLVTTKGLPHRIQDTDFFNAGDNPTNQSTEIQNNDATAAAADAELALLWQNLSQGEAGNNADSKADGIVQNPFWRSMASITTFPQTNNQVQKVYQGNGFGPVWVPFGAVGSATRLAAGDIYLVSRLDGNTVADVRGAIDRAGSILYNTLAHVAMFDESGANGIDDGNPGSEFDNIGSAFPVLWDADDYERTRNDFNADTRFAGTFARYNGLAGGNQFFVGPRLPWFPGDGVPLNEVVVLVATYGANHSGIPRDPAGNTRRTTYAESYNYTNGSIINTIESYNCRDFGGVGQLSFAMQQQVAGFIAAGGTFGVGNCWEPLADAIPDNRLLALNFIRGNMSWAEAAWSAIPGLSWAEMAVGDPLGRPSRTSEDIDGNQRVNLDDLYAWEASPSDVDRNGTTNAADRAHVHAAIRSWERVGMMTPR